MENQQSFKKFQLKPSFKIPSNDIAIFDILNKAANKFETSPTYSKYGLGKYSDIYLVAGGYGRDLLLGKVSNDIDLIIHANLIRIFLRQLMDGNPEIIELTRDIFVLKFGAVKGSYYCQISILINKKPHLIDIRSTWTSDLMDDYKTRDFTMNSLYFRFKEGDCPYLLMTDEVYYYSKHPRFIVI